MNSSSGILELLIAAVCVLLTGNALAAPGPSAYLDELFLPHRYAAGKNSFHVRDLARGEKKGRRSQQNLTPSRKDAKEERTNRTP